MSETIVITIGKAGEVTMKALGFKGSACKLATKPFEKAFGGDVVSDKPTSEMYDKPVKNVAKAGY